MLRRPRSPASTYAIHLLSGAQTYEPRKPETSRRSCLESRSMTRRSLRLLFEQAVHAGIHIGANVRDVDVHLRVAFVDGGLGSAVETEPGEDQIVVAPGCRPDDLFDHLCGDRAVLRAEHYTDSGRALRIVIGFANVGPSPFG